MTYGFSIKLKKGSSVTDEGPGRAPFAFIVFLLAFRLLADIHPALGSGGCFQLLQGQLDGGVTVARCRVDGIKLAQALVFHGPGVEDGISPLSHHANRFILAKTNLLLGAVLPQSGFLFFRCLSAR